MRVLLVNQRFWPAATGSERWLLAMGRRMVAEGHTVAAATSDGFRDDFALNPRTPRVEAPDSIDGIAIRRFPIRPLPGSPATHLALRYGLAPILAALPVPTAWLFALSRLAPPVPDLYRWLRSDPGPYDLVLCANIVADGTVAAAAVAARRWGARIALVPFTHLGAGRVPGADRVGRQYTQRHQRQLGASVDHLLVMTETERDFYLDAGARPGNVHVVGGGVDEEAFQPGDVARCRQVLGTNEPIVAYIAPSHPYKGVLQLADAVERLWAQGEALTLVTAGTAYPDGQRRLDQLATLRPESVRILPHVNQTEKRDLLAASVALAMPSRTDSFGIVFPEAWAQRRPVIGSTAWGMRDVIADGEDGFLVPFGDGPALAEALGRLLKDEALRARLGENGLRKARARYMWDHVYEKVKAAVTTAEGRMTKDE